MFKNYLISAFRNLSRNKFFSIINVGGLAIGLAAVLLIMLFVRDQFSYDKFWSDADNIYRLQTSYNPPGREPVRPIRTNGLISGMMVSEIPEIETSARFAPFKASFRVGDRLFSNGIAMIDPQFLDIFEMQILAGSIEAYQNDPSGMVISRSTAQSLFGSVSEAMDQVVRISFLDVTIDYKISAVIDTLPEQSHILLPALIHLKDYGFSDFETMFGSWFNTYNYTYFKVYEGVNIKLLEKKLLDLVDRNGPQMTSMPEIEKPSQFITPSIMNIQDIQLYSEGHGEMKATGDIKTVGMFSIAAFLILLIAGLNFTNLTTARSTARAKEVALRRVNGASRPNLITQFLGEAILLSLIALLVAFVIVEAASPFFSAFLGRPQVFQTTSDPFILFFGLFTSLSVGILAGLYPAFYLSRALPARILRGGKTSEPPAVVRMRASLILFQFVLTTALMGLTAIVYFQVNYTLNKDLGFNVENTLVLRNFDRPEARSAYVGLYNDLQALEGVVTVSRASQVPGDTENSNWTLRLEGDGQQAGVTMGKIEIDDKFFPSLDVNFLSGRNFSKAISTDELMNDPNAMVNRNYSGAVILNMSAIRALGLGNAEEAIGKVIVTPTPLTIIGVIPDIHFYSLKAEIRPEMYLFWGPNYRALSLRLDEGADKAIIEKIGAIWANHVPDVPFQFEYLEDILEKNYGNEKRQAQTLTAFSLLAIIVACFGLYGMASFMIERRTKEIGIRKVFGATVLEIVGLFLWQISKPIIWANLIAWPLALYIANEWLMSFSYRIDLWTMGLLICLFVALGVFILAWATVSGYAFKVARTNPILALSYE